MMLTQNHPPVFQFHARRGTEWAAASISLGRPCQGARIVETTPDFESELTGADKDSAGYSLNNWLSGVGSGANYAFRALGLPRRQVLVLNLSGSLGADGIQALAEGTAAAIARLLGRELPSDDATEWEVEASLAEPETE